nr:uncharacterized protein LOC127347903 [Lolium perenne]
MNGGGRGGRAGEDLNQGGGGGSGAGRGGVPPEPGARTFGRGNGPNQGSGFHQMAGNNGANPNFRFGESSGSANQHQYVNNQRILNQQGNYNGRNFNSNNFARGFQRGRDSNFNYRRNADFQAERDGIEHLPAGLREIWIDISGERREDREALKSSLKNAFEEHHPGAALEIHR